MILREAIDNGWLRFGTTGGSRAPVWSIPPDVGDMYGSLDNGDPRKLHPYRAWKLAEQARRFSPQELSLAETLSLQAHEQLVSSTASQPLVLEMLLFNIACSPPPRKTAKTG